MEGIGTTSLAKSDANRLNAQNSTGPISDEGKAVVRMNALKHGLLSREVIIRQGDAKEDEGEYTSLLESLCQQLSPEGSIEELLVERIAVCYWRLRRAARFEVGVLRDELDRAISGYKPLVRWNGNEVEILADYDALVESENRAIKANKHCIKLLKDELAIDREYEESMGIAIWSYYHNLISLKYTTDDWTDPDLDGDRFDEEEMTVEEMREFLQKKGWTDDKLRKNFIEQDLVGIHECKKRLEELMEQKRGAELKKSRLIQAKSLPDTYTMDRLLRYETAIERQLYRALDQLERLQRLRIGDSVPAPLTVRLISENG